MLAVIALAAFAVLVLGCFAYVIGGDVRAAIHKPREAANRPHPDYSAIAAMELEVYGETFKHEGAPARAPSRKCGHGGSRACDGGCGNCEQWRDRNGRPRRVPEPPEPGRCYCNWCRGRPGVHGAEAIALYQAEASAVLAAARAAAKAPNTQNECDNCSKPLGTGVRYHDAGYHYCEECERKRRRG